MKFIETLWSTLKNALFVRINWAIIGMLGLAIMLFFWNEGDHAGFHKFMRDTFQ